MKERRTKTTIGILLIIFAVLLTNTQAYTALKDILWHFTGSVGIAAIGVIVLTFLGGTVLVRESFTS